MKNRKVSKYYETDCLENFLLLLMFFVIAKSAKKKSYFGYNSFYLSRKRIKTNLTLLWYQISISLNRSENKLPNKASFSNFIDT